MLSSSLLTSISQQILLFSNPKTLKPSLSLSSSATITLAMKDRPPSSCGSVYVPPHLRLRSVISRPNCISPSSASHINSKVHDNYQTAVSNQKNSSPVPYFQQQKQQTNGVAQNNNNNNNISTTANGNSNKNNNHKFISAYDDGVSEEGSDREMETSMLLPGASLSDNIMEWKQKLTMLLHDKEKLELVSREKKDRRDFDQIAALASRMGLYSHLYAKVVVFSKIPLPNYRFDLDDRRPQREVILPLGLQRRVDAYLGDYLFQKSKIKERFPDISFSRSSSSCSLTTDEGLFEQPDPLASSKTVMEKIMWRRSMQLRDQQHAWQDSQEGRKMLEFRKTLPAYKEKDAILGTISGNQCLCHG